jgi:hypothetical protein
MNLATGDADAGPSLDAELLHLLGFLKAKALPPADRAAEMGIDPTPLFAMVVRVLRTYADALEDAAKAVAAASRATRSASPAAARRVGQGTAA